MDQSKVLLTIVLLSLATAMVFSRVPVGFAIMLWPLFPKWRRPAANWILRAVGVLTVSGFVVAAIVVAMWGGLDGILPFVLAFLALLLTPLLLWGLKAQLAAIESRSTRQSSNNKSGPD
jgi:hypothetical protein